MIVFEDKKHEHDLETGHLQEVGEIFPSQQLDNDDVDDVDVEDDGDICDDV